MIASFFSRRDFIIATSALAGGMTQIPMLIAEELQCDWAKIRADLKQSGRCQAYAASL